MMNYVLKEDLQYIADYNLPYKKLKGKSAGDWCNSANWNIIGSCPISNW